MPMIHFSDQQVQQLQQVLGEIPWKIAHPLMVAIAVSMQAQQEPGKTAVGTLKGNNHDADRPADQP